MSLRIWLVGPVVACGLIAVAAGGCSSSSNGAGAPDDAGSDGAIHRMLDGSGAISGDDGGSGATATDGTTGKACTTDQDCAAANGPGVNVCSSSFPGSVGGLTVQFWSTPVCIVSPNTPCDPAPGGDGSGPHYCDGPDKSTSPGLCVPFDLNNPVEGEGLCYPKCSYTLGGSATGCTGSNVCNLDWLFAPTGSTITGVGFCGSVCQKDADCSALGTGYACQTDLGLCTMKTVTRKKAVGDSCFVASDGGADDDTTGACNCLPSNSGTGFCTSECVTGGAGCPDGWICEDGESATPFTGAPAQTTTTKGVAGFCVPGCTPTDGGVPEAASPTPEASTEDDGGDAAPATPATDAAAANVCPGGSACVTTTLAGPDCLFP
jgi:hypothetical protein